MQGALSKGLGLGATFCTMMLMWALLFWYSNSLIGEGVTNGGKVLAAMFAVLVGAL